MMEWLKESEKLWGT